MGDVHIRIDRFRRLGIPMVPDVSMLCYSPLTHPGSSLLWNAPRTFVPLVSDEALSGAEQTEGNRNGIKIFLGSLGLMGPSGYSGYLCYWGSRGIWGTWGYLEIKTVPPSFGVSYFADWLPNGESCFRHVSLEKICFRLRSPYHLPSR